MVSDRGLGGACSDLYGRGRGQCVIGFAYARYVLQAIAGKSEVSHASKTKICANCLDVSCNGDSHGNHRFHLCSASIVSQLRSHYERFFLDLFRLGPHPAVLDTFHIDLLVHEGESGRIWLQSETETASFHS